MRFEKKINDGILWIYEFNIYVDEKISINLGQPETN